MTSRYSKSVPPIIPGDSLTTTIVSDKFSATKNIVTLEGNILDYDESNPAVSNNSSGTFYFPNPTDNGGGQFIFTSNKLDLKSSVTVTFSGGLSNGRGFEPEVNPTIYSFNGSLYVYVETGIDGPLNSPAYINFVIM